MSSFVMQAPSDTNASLGFILDMSFFMLVTLPAHISKQVKLTIATLGPILEDQLS